MSSAFHDGTNSKCAANLSARKAHDYGSCLSELSKSLPERSVIRLCVQAACVCVALSLAACQWQEHREWSTARKDDSIQAYEAFLARYPEGRNALKAREAIAWKRAVSANTIRAYRQFQEKYTGSPFSSQISARIQAAMPASLDRSFTLLNSRRYQEAITELEAILELRSNDALALNNLAVAQAMTNRFDDALKTLGKARQNAGAQKVHEIGYVSVFASRSGGLRSLYSVQPEDAADAFSHDNHRLHTLKLPFALLAGDSMSQHLFDPKKVRVSERTPVNSLSYWIELNSSALR